MLKLGNISRIPMYFKLNCAPYNQRILSGVQNLARIRKLYASICVLYAYYRCCCRSPACNTVIEIVDGPPSSRKKPSKKICSPETKHARDHGGSFLEHQTFVSTGNILTLLLRRPAATNPSSKDVEFVDGAFLFHDGKSSFLLLPYYGFVYTV